MTKGKTSKYNSKTNEQPQKDEGQEIIETTTAEEPTEEVF